MSIKKRYEKLLDSSIAKLTDNDKTVGMRLKIYDMEYDTYVYFDFSTSVVKSSEIKTFLKERLADFQSLPLCKRVVRKEIVDGKEVDMCYAMTQEEYDNKLVISEFKSEQEAHGYLSLMMKIYAWKTSPLEF